jgi:hypothetical protein
MRAFNQSTAKVSTTWAMLVGLVAMIGLVTPAVGAAEIERIPLREPTTSVAIPVVHRVLRAQPPGAAPVAPANPPGPSPSFLATPPTMPPDPFAVPMTGEIKLTPITQLTTHIGPSKGELPRNHAAETFQGAPQALNSPDGLRVGAPFYSTPRAAGFVHRPLYFEERAVERHGRSWGPLQPAASGMQFFATLPVLPYKMGARPQRETISTGNGVHSRSDRLTLREHLRGAFVEATAVTGAGFAIP